METVKIMIPGDPRTKKNSQRLVRSGGRIIPIPSRQYKEYEREAGRYLEPLTISEPVNLKAVYYMGTRRRVDLVNLLEATCDILVHHKVLEDDNSRIIQSTDGSRVLYDKERPRVEITITPAGA